ncbi:MAG: phosphoribosyltransferase family protein [Bacillota bacterium]|nr:phosphoribosyltransferase family protein [Bacillota bacterium]
MKTTYEITLGGVKRDLPLCRLNDNLQIAAFVVLGDYELTCACAKLLAEKAPPHDIILTAECKGIPLVHEMAKVLNEKKHIIARKNAKLYMKNIFRATVKSITTKGEQILYLDGTDAELIKGKRVLIVDDVVSTGESLRALEDLVKLADGEIAGKMTILAEGDAQGRDDIIYLAPLPLFDNEGEPLAE